MKIATADALPSPAVRLQRLAALARELGATAQAHEAEALATRLQQGGFYVACVGQFKRGKSTLIDALVSDHLLPADVIPVTAVPTVVRYGENRGAQVRLRDAGGWRAIPLAAVPDYVSQARNPDNRKGVEGVEIYTPAALLASGMCLVDTPGLGSIFAANTEAARAFVPQIDAALVVFGADPPLAGTELDLVAAIAAHASDLIFVLNKADRVSEVDRATAVGFARQALAERLGREVGRIYEISALDVIHGRSPARDWLALTAALERLASESAQRLRQTAGERGAQRLAVAVLRAIDEQSAALERPLRDSEQRIAVLRDIVAAAERSLGDLSALLGAEQHRLWLLFGERRARFLPGCRRAALVEFDAELRALPRGTGPAWRRAAMRAAQQVARRHLQPWLEAEQSEAEREFGNTMRRFFELAQGFLARSAAAGVVAPPVEEAFFAPSQFQFFDFIEVAQPASPIRWAADWILGMLRAYGPIRSDACRLLHLLLDTNTARVQNDLRWRAAESRRKLESDLRARLLDVVADAERALQRATDLHAQGTRAVASALTSLAAMRVEIAGMSHPMPPG